MNIKLVPAALVVALLVLVTLLEWHTIHDPHYWDAIQGVVAPALDCHDHGLRLIHRDGLNFGHPPLQPLVLALTWKIFGLTLEAAHLLTIAIGLLGLYFTYRLGRLVFDPAVGVGAAVLLAFDQLFFAQTGILNDAIPLLTLGVLTVYFHLGGRPICYLVSATALVLTKETAALVLVAIALDRLAERWWVARRLRVADLRETMFLLSPLIVLLAWFAYQRAMLGWLFHPDHLPFSNAMVEGRWNLLLYFVKRFVRDLAGHFLVDLGVKNVNRFNVILTAAIVAALVTRRLRAGRVLGLFASIILLHCVLFALTVNLPRYFLPLMPFYYLLGARAVLVLLPRHRLQPLAYALAIGTLAVLMTTNYRGKRDRPGFELESNLEYRDLIATHVQAARFLESRHPGALVYTNWPMTDELTEPRFGYVDRPLGVTTHLPSAASELLVYHSFQSSRPGFLDGLDRSQLRLIARFEQNGKSAEIYECSQRAP
jgi:hypothetical protein